MNLRKKLCHTISSCGNQKDLPNFFAQYGTVTNPSSGDMISFYESFRQGAQISLEEEKTIILQPGYLYLVNYVFLGTPEPEGYLEIVPHINGQPGLLYSFFSASGNTRNASAAASFTTNAALSEAAMVEFRITYSEITRNINLSGTVSITPIIGSISEILCKRP